MTALERYLQVRRRAGSSRIEFRDFSYLGQQPNPGRKDAVGWRFALGKPDGRPAVPFQIWVGTELIQRLKLDGVDVFDALLAAGERLAEDKMLRPDKPWRDNHDIELTIADRVRLLAAAGRAPDFLLPSEAPLEEGVPVMFELTVRDSVWVGEYLSTSRDAKFADVVVDWTYRSGRRILSTVRLLREPLEGLERVEAVIRALAAYRDRCRRLGIVPGTWAHDVELRMSGGPN